MSAAAPIASKVESLLRLAVLDVVGDLNRRQSSARALAEALVEERHEAIREKSDGVDFWARGAALRMAQHALAEGDKRTAAQMLRWVDKGVPRNERDTILSMLTDI